MYSLNLKIEDVLFLLNLKIDRWIPFRDRYLVWEGLEEENGMRNIEYK